MIFPFKHLPFSYFRFFRVFRGQKILIQLFSKPHQIDHKFLLCRGKLLYSLRNTNGLLSNRRLLHRSFLFLNELPLLHRRSYRRLLKFRFFLQKNDYLGLKIIFWWKNLSHGPRTWGMARWAARHCDTSFSTKK